MAKQDRLRLVIKFNIVECESESWGLAVLKTVCREKCAYLAFVYDDSLLKSNVYWTISLMSNIRIYKAILNVNWVSQVRY